ncbi:MAG: NarK/NasA family nitrate transporter [Acidobacteria bacterium]|nr:NarK/NasA family nitrate transporter [Acidobacteriota bacterium]
MLTESAARQRVLWLSTIAFTLMFNVWLMLGVLGIPIRRELGLTDVQLEWLIATAILSGALFRLNAGIWADQYGGRIVMCLLLAVSAVSAYVFSHATTYAQLLVCSVLFGLAGNSFSAGVSWNSAWFPRHQAGTALGVFGAGNVGAAGTKLLIVLVPGILTAVPAAGYWGGLIPGGWRFIPALYAALLVCMGLAIVAFSPKPDRQPGKGRRLRDALAPLRHVRVWRFSLYYIVVFGAYVALSAWLPKFYVDTYGVSLSNAALLAASFILPASLLRPAGGYLSDRYGPRVITYGVFIVMTATLLLLSLPSGTFVADLRPGVHDEPFTFSYHLGLWPFAGLMFVLGCAMGIGKASVYKYIPDYFPTDVGAVGGVVGMLGALGGFFLPPAFGILTRWSGVPQLAFVPLLALTVWSLLWLHLAVLRLRGPVPLVGADNRLPAHHTATSPL